MRPVSRTKTRIDLRHADGGRDENNRDEDEQCEGKYFELWIRGILSGRKNSAYLSQKANRRHSAGGSIPFWQQAATSVLRSRQAMVIGPTPPGTGVIAPAISNASG